MVAVRAEHYTFRLLSNPTCFEWRYIRQLHNKRVINKNPAPSEARPARAHLRCFLHHLFNSTSASLLRQPGGYVRCPSSPQHHLFTQNRYCPFRRQRTTPCYYGPKVKDKPTLINVTVATRVRPLSLARAVPVLCNSNKWS